MKPTDILGNIKLYNADCMEVMKTFKDNQFDLAIIDPPYGLGDKLTNGGTWSVRWQAKGADWDKVPTKEYWEQLFRISKNWIVFGGNYFIEHLPNCRNFIAWHKPYMDGMGTMSNVELALTSFDRNAKKISINKDKGNENRIHLTQKPVQLYKWLLQNYAKDGDTILDTHFGSLSIGIACHDMKFDLTAIELDKDYYEQAKQRLINHQRQLTLF